MRCQAVTRRWSPRGPTWSPRRRTSASLAPAPFDDALAIELAVTRLGSTGMGSSFWMARGEQTLAEVHLRHVFVTAAGGAKTPIPGALRTGLAPYLAHAMVAGNAG